jgi:hypothetical protein
MASVPEIGALRCMSCGWSDHEGPCNPRSSRENVEIETDRNDEERRRRREEEDRQWQEYVRSWNDRRQQMWDRTWSHAALLTTEQLEWYARDDHTVLELQLQERWEPPLLTRQLKEIEARVRSMITLARERGAHFAADNLKEWVNGTWAGRTKVVDPTMLRGHRAIAVAETEAREGLVERLMAKARELAESGELPDGGEVVIDSARFSDMSNAKVVVKPVPLLSELYYASNRSLLRSYAEVRIRRQGFTFEIAGTVSYKWNDTYDWNEGDIFYIPRTGIVLANELRLLEVHRAARTYEMRSEWKSQVTGQFSFDPDAGVADYFDWSDAPAD